MTRPTLIRLAAALLLLLALAGLSIAFRYDMVSCTDESCTRVDRWTGRPEVVPVYWNDGAWRRWNREDSRIRGRPRG